MKSFTCLWVISLFSCCFSNENVVLKCGSPTCDEKISEARVHITYHSDGLHLKRGRDTVSIYGKNNQRYYIKQGDHFGFVPLTFLQEINVYVKNDDLVNASEEFMSKFQKKDLHDLAATPPLGNESLTADAPENNKVESLEEISSSKPYEVVDGTTLYMDDDFTPPSPKPPYNEAAESSANLSELPEVQKVEIKSEAAEKTDPLESEEKVKEELSKSDEKIEKIEILENEEKTEIKSETEEKSSEPEIKLEPTAGNTDQVESEEQLGDENEDEDEDEDEIDEEVESEESGFAKALGALFGDSEDVPEKPSGTQSVPEETPSLGDDLKRNDGDDVQTPSTADIFGGSVQNTQLYEPTPMIFPSKTEASTVEATVQPVLSENAESAKSVETLVASTEDHPQDQADFGVEEVSAPDVSNIAVSKESPSVDVNDELKDSVESSSIEVSMLANDSAAVGEEVPSDSVEASTIQPILKEETYESSISAALPDKTVPVDEVYNGSSSEQIIPSESPIKVDTGFLPTFPPSEESPESVLTPDIPIAEFAEQPSDVQESAEEDEKVTPEIIEPETTPAETESLVVDETEATTIAYGEAATESESSHVAAPESNADLNDSLILLVAEEQTASTVLEEAETYVPTEESFKANETDGITPSPEEPVRGIYDSLISAKPSYEEVGQYPTVTSDAEPVKAETEKLDSVIDEGAEPAQEPEKTYPATVEEPVPTPSEDTEAVSEDQESSGIFGRVLEVGYDSISSMKEISLFGFWSGKTEDDIQSAWRDEKLDSSHYSMDDTCKIEDQNCPSLKQEEKIVTPPVDPAPTMDSAPAVDFTEQSSETMFSPLLDSLVSSTCMRAQSLLIFLTTAVVLIFSASCYFYLDKRSKDSSFFQRIDSLEKQLFISKKEALEYEKRLKSLPSNLGNAEADSEVLVMNSAHINELEAQRNELSEKVELLSNELSVTIGMNKDLEKRLQEALASTQDTEMIFKTVDQLQRAVEMQQKSSSELKAQIKNKDIAIEELGENLQKSMAYASSLEELLATLKRDNEKLSIESSEKIIHLASELDQVKSEKTLESTKLKGEIDGLKLSLEQARASLEVAEASIVELKAIISEDAKNVDSLGEVFNGSELKAKLAVAELNVEKLKDRLQEETGARQFLEEHVTSVTDALNQLKASYSDLEKEKQEAENAVKVLKDYFRKQEEELKKEIEEKSAFQLQKDEETLFIKLKTLEEEKNLLKSQIDEMKKEIVEQENIFSRERVQLEKKADDNWLLSRQIKRKLDDSKQEAALLRSRLTTVEKLLIEKNEDPDNDQSIPNGDGTQQPTNVSSPSMLLNFPSTANSSFAKYNSPDLNFPPPLLPGAEFIPPPPIYHPDLRLPPLGSVARIPSPPRGMSPPLSLETNFGINFSPPPPMPPPQYYYYHRSDSPSDYDSSSYSKGDRYRDSPSNLESSGSSKNKPGDQPDSYPPSNSSHPPPLKPVARNPTSAGQKGWNSSGQPNKSVEKNSRKPGR